MDDCEQTLGEQLANEVRAFKLAPCEKLVLMEMAEATDDDSIFRKDAEYLHKNTGYSIEQCRRAIRSLLKTGYLTIAQAHSGRRKAFYGFDFSNKPLKSSLQKVVTNEASDNNLSQQKVVTTHSHADLTPQDVVTTGNGEIPLNNPPKDKKINANKRTRAKTQRDIENEEFEARWKTHRDTAIELMRVWDIRVDFVDPDKMVNGSRMPYLEAAEEFDAAEFNRGDFKIFRKWLHAKWKRNDWTGKPTLNSMRKYAEEFRSRPQQGNVTIKRVETEKYTPQAADAETFIAELSAHMHGETS